MKGCQQLNSPTQMKRYIALSSVVGDVNNCSSIKPEPLVPLIIDAELHLHQYRSQIVYKNPPEQSSGFSYELFREL